MRYTVAVMPPRVTVRDGVPSPEPDPRVTVRSAVPSPEPDPRVTVRSAVPSREPDPRVTVRSAVPSREPDPRVTVRSAVPSLEPEDDPGIHGSHRPTASSGSMDCRVKPRPVRFGRAWKARAPRVPPTPADRRRSRREPRKPFLHPSRPSSPHAAGYGGNPPARREPRAAHGFPGSHGPRSRYPEEVTRTLTGQDWVKPGNDNGGVGARPTASSGSTDWGVEPGSDNGGVGAGHRLIGEPWP
jgi:hypothetical protein